MGENFKLDQAAGFRGRMTRGHEGLSRETLLAGMRPESLERHFTCAVRTGCPFDVGDEVIIRADDAIDVMRGSIVVGFVEAEDVEDLRSGLLIGRGMLRARIMSVGVLGDTFTVKIDEDSQ